MSEFFEDYANLISNIETLTKDKAGYGYKYVELSSLLTEVMPKIHANNFILIQTIRSSDKIVTREKSDKNGIVKYSSPTFFLKTTLRHESGEVLESELPLLMDDLDPQAFGSAETYMRRYALYALLNIQTEDDDGVGASARGKENKKAQEDKMPLPQNVQELATFLARCENPSVYYWDVKNRTDIDDNTKQKLIRIIYPK